MQTVVNEINTGIYRLSTYIEAMDFSFNQILIDAEEPLLFHCGMRGLFPSVSQALRTVMPPERLRWISFGHFESDECGALNDWLAAAPRAQPVFGEIGCMISLDDFAARRPRPLKDGEVLDLGGKRVRYLATPHVPHGWDAGVLHEEGTGTLLCGDLFTQGGKSGALTESDILGPAFALEDQFHATALTPQTAATLRRLAALRPNTLALMHGPAYRGDGELALKQLADGYAERFARAAA